MTPDLTGKRLELLKEMLPEVTRVAVQLGFVVGGPEGRGHDWARGRPHHFATGAVVLHVLPVGEAARRALRLVRSAGRTRHHVVAVTRVDIPRAQLVMAKEGSPPTYV
jgi:KaiC/GvpD/RAD55 family RecA-like ATPase